MSWISDAYDAVSGFFSGGGGEAVKGATEQAPGWFARNSDWLKPVGAGVADLIGGQISSSGKEGTLDAYKNALLDDYNRQTALAQQYAQWQQGQAGASRAAAASADAARRAGAKQQLRSEKRAFNQANSYLEPYRQAGLEVLPAMTGAYKSGVNNLNLLQGYVNTPDAMARLNASKPAFDIQVPLPEQLKPRA